VNLVVISYPSKLSLSSCFFVACKHFFSFLPFASLLEIPSSIFLLDLRGTSYLVSELRLPSWPSFQAQTPSQTRPQNPTKSQLTDHTKINLNRAGTEFLHGLPVLFGTTVPLSIFPNSVQKCGTVSPCPSARPCHPHTLPKHSFSLLKEPTCLQALP